MVAHVLLVVLQTLTTILIKLTHTHTILRKGSYE